jgi:hypothetical protein
MKIVFAKLASLYPQPQRDRSRLPLPGDTGFAWDKLYHRSSVRWECRATPSGQFVRQSFCANLPQLDGPKPAAFSSTEGWDGMLHTD